MGEKGETNRRAKRAGGRLGGGNSSRAGSPFRVASEASRERTHERGEAREAAVALSPFQSTAGLTSLDGFFTVPPPLFHFFPALRSLVLSYWKKCSSTQRRTYYFEMLSSSSQVQSKSSDKIFRNVRTGLDVRSYQQLMPRKYFSQPSSRQQRENLL